MKNAGLIFQEIQEIEDEIIEIRRQLHRYPELSFHEEKTPEYIADFHRRLGNDVLTGVGGRGVVAKLVGGKPGKTVALRADFDALPVQEENDIPYKSTVRGVMHACGHDGHTAIVLGLAKALSRIRDRISGTVVFIHQHAEEIVPGGAIEMIKDGCLNGVDYIYGLHLWAPFRLGEIHIAKSNLMAATDKFEIEITGKGGHGGIPHESSDLIVLASQLIVSLQSVVSRRINPFDPVVLSIGSIHAGQSFNVLPDKIEITGTVRAFSDAVRKRVESEMKRILEGTCQTSGVQHRFDYQYGYPAVVNHPKEAERIISVARDVPGVTGIVDMQPMMIGEDFAYYLKEKPGAFFLMGACDPENKNPYPHHHPKFSFDERVLPIASKVMGSIALNVLANT
jgi:amidohydrolase